MKDKPENPTAFPHNNARNSGCSNGMTLRDYFAAAALQGLLTNSQIAKDCVKMKLEPEFNQSWHAETAYKFADAMLKVRQS